MSNVGPRHLVMSQKANPSPSARRRDLADSNAPKFLNRDVNDGPCVGRVNFTGVSITSVEEGIHRGLGYSGMESNNGPGDLGVTCQMVDIGTKWTGGDPVRMVLLGCGEEC